MDDMEAMVTESLATLETNLRSMLTILNGKIYALGTASEFELAKQINDAYGLLLTINWQRVHELEVEFKTPASAPVHLVNKLQ